jgi:hypothetical protein
VKCVDCQCFVVVGGVSTSLRKYLIFFCHLVLAI